MKSMRANLSQLILQLQDTLIDAKLMVIRKLDSVRGLVGTFMEKPNGFEVSNGEGFVAVNRISQNTIKLVDRLVFSKSNFNLH